MYSALFTLNTMTEVLLSKAPNPQLPTAPGVCVHFECRAQIQSMGNYTWPRHFFFFFTLIALVSKKFKLERKN